MLLYFKTLAVILFFILQYVFVLPHYISSNDWWEFTLGWFILLVIDPILIYKLWQDAATTIDDLFEDVK